MQGTLNEIDLRSILQLIELGQRTGELLVEAYPTGFGDSDGLSEKFPGRLSSLKNRDLPRKFWLVFFVNGQIVYTTNGESGYCRRLKEYLYHYRLEITPENLEKAKITSSNDLEYTYLWQLIEQDLLTPLQGRSIIQQMAQETLFDLLSLHQGDFIFETGMPFNPLLTSLAIEPLVTQMMKKIQQWKQFYPHLQNPQQCLMITNHHQLHQALPRKAYEQLLRWANKKTSLRQFSRYLHKDLASLAKGIYPYLERGWLQIVTPAMTYSARSTSCEKLETDYRPHIVCIDDDFSISKQIEGILEENNYKASLIIDPLQSLSSVFELNPDLILCDIAMPKLDGYEICAMLRHSSFFRYIPIIMLTGKEGFTDRIKARMAGATDYLTKPFGEQELLFLIEKYVKVEIDT
ncbi:MAG: response regulator [Cyanobacteria bacterium P01_G01_bin.49]